MPSIDTLAAVSAAFIAGAALGAGAMLLVAREAFAKVSEVNAGLAARCLAMGLALNKERHGA